MEVPKYYLKIKYYLRRENKVNKNKVLSYCDVIVYPCINLRSAKSVKDIYSINGGQT